MQVLGFEIRRKATIRPILKRRQFVPNYQLPIITFVMMNPEILHLETGVPKIDTRQ